MENNDYSIDWSKYVKKDNQTQVSFDNFKNDKINREFLSNHIGEKIILWGYFDRIVNDTKALIQNCGFEEHNINISLGHMWWSDFVQNKPENKEYKYGEYVSILGEIYEYKNTDTDYGLKFTYGARVIKIL